MNSQRIKQNWSNLDPEMKDLAVKAILEFAKAFRMKLIIDKSIIKDPELTKRGQIEIDSTKVYNIIIMFDVNEIHIVGNLNDTKSMPSNAN